MKKKIAKSLLAVSLISAMSVTMLAGCGGKKEGGESGGGDSNVLKVAAFEGGNGAAIWEQIAAAFEE